MPVDRDLYREALTKKGAPSWPCPRCKGGHFRLVKDALAHYWTADTNEASNELAFEASWVTITFVTILKCDNERCGEVAAIAGTGQVREYPNEEMTELLHEDLFYPKYFFPSPRLISVPPNCPTEVVEELERAFVASWGDYACAGNRIRSAVERLLDALRVPQQVVAKKGRRRPVNLHDRISSIRTKYPVAHDALMAVKWVGNAGSHSNELTRDAVFDGLDILEFVLSELYSKHPSAIKRLVKAINRRKGPVQGRSLKSRRSAKGIRST